LAALVCAAVPMLADSNARIVRLSYLEGDVQIDRGAGQGFERAVLNMPVIGGARLATHEHATAEVEFEDGSTLRLLPGTEVAFRQLSLRSSGVRVSKIELDKGTAYLESRNKKDDFSVTAAGREFSLLHEAHTRITRSDSQVSLAVFKGEVELSNAVASVRVKKNQTLNLDLNDPSQYQLAKGIEANSYDDWNQRRDDYRESYAANHRDGYNSLYSYGWSDLNYFGNFYDSASYGLLWRPFGVGPGWDPFSDGAWMYYPGYGYMWVSGYPWGWMPYRYGTWLFVPGLGWGWRPATLWSTWNAVPVIYSPPAGYVPPRPPSSKPGAGIHHHTVVVGSGPITDVQNPRYHKWVERTKSGGAARHQAGVEPVMPPPAPSGTVANQPNVSGGKTAAPAGNAGRRHEHSGMKRTTPQPKAAVPAPAPPPPSTPPPAVTPSYSGGAASGGGGQGASHKSPHK